MARRSYQGLDTAQRIGPFQSSATTQHQMVFWFIVLPETTQLSVVSTSRESLDFPSLRKERRKVLLRHSQPRRPNILIGLPTVNLICKFIDSPTNLAFRSIIGMARNG